MVRFMSHERKAPGYVRDAIIGILSERPDALSISEIQERVSNLLGPTSASSVRSYLRLNTPETFVREGRGKYRVRSVVADVRQRELPAIDDRIDSINIGMATLIHSDCIEWLESAKANTIHAVVTDPPYGLHEYSPEQQLKLRNGKGGVWRIPPSFDGHTRAPLPRFTTLTDSQREALREFCQLWARLLLPCLVPGANVIIASNPLLSFIVSGAMADVGFERRGEIARLVMTMRGGDRPKAAHKEFQEVSMMPRSMWEPWLVYRKPMEGRAMDNLRTWGTGGFRRPTVGRPFGDVIKSSPTQKNERAIAPHPSLKPQAFLRQVVRAVLPLGTGVVLDPFAGAGSTLAACEAVGYSSIGIEKDRKYFEVARRSIGPLAQVQIKS